MGGIDLGSVKAKIEVDASGAEDGVRKATEALNSFSQSTAASASAIGQATAAWDKLFKAAEAGAAALFGAYNASIQLAHELTNLSARTQVGVETLQKYKLAGDDVGVSIERLSMSIFRMQKGLAGGKQDSLLRQLGLDPEQLRAASPEKSFEAIGAAILKVGNAAQQASLSTQLLGDRGGQTLQFLRAGGLEAANEMERLGVVMSTKTVTALQEVWAQADDLNDVWQGLIRNIALTIAPTEMQAGALQGLKEALGVASKALQDWNAEQQRSPDLQAQTAQATFNWAAGMVDVAHAVVAAWYGIKAGVSDVIAWLAEKFAAFGEIQAKFISTLAKIPGPQQEVLKEYASTLQAGVDFYKSWAFAEKQASKDAVSAADQTLSAIEAIQKRLSGYKVPAAGLPPGPKPPISGDVPGDVKQLQTEMDRLSGAKAQEQMNLVATAVAEITKKGQAAQDIDALGKQLVKLGSDGAKVPAALMGTWSDAFIKEASKVGKLPTNAEMLTKSVAQAYKQNSTLIKQTLKDDEASWKAYEDARQEIARGTEEVLHEQMRLGTMSVKEETAARITEIQTHYGELIARTQDVLSRTKDLGQREHLAGLIAAYEELAQKEIDATVALGKYQQTMQLMAGLSSVLGGVAQLFDAIGISADSAAGKILDVAQGSIAAGQNFQAALGDKGWKGASTAQKGAAVGSALGTAGDVYKTGQEKGVGAGMLSGAGKGAMIGMAFGPWGAAIGAVAGAVVGLVGGLNKPEYKKIMADVGKNWGAKISEGLGKEIEAIAKTHGLNRTLASLLATSKIIGESGKDPREFTDKINDLMNAIKTGAVPAKEGLAELGKSFDLVAKAAIEAGTVGDKAMVGILKRAREMGQVTPEMKAFVGAQLDSALQGISKYVAALGTLSKAAEKGGEAQARFAEIGKTSGVVFGAMFDAMVAEKGITAAVDAMKADYQSLHETLSRTLGADAVGVILGPVGGAFATLANETLRPMFEGIDGITQAMTGLANAGYLSTDQFVAMQDATAQLFDEAVAGGADMRTALQAVAPGIQAAISAAEQFGVPLDADMARLKALAEQNGITFATDPQAAMLDVLVSIAEVLGAEVPASAQRAKAAMMDMANSVPNDLSFDVNVNRNISDNYYGGGGGGGGAAAPEGGGGAPAFAPFMPGGEEPFEGFQHGSGGIRDFGAGTPVVLHGREAVVTEQQAQTMGGATATFNATFNVDPLQSNAARDDLAQFVIDEFIRQARSSPMIRQLLRQDGGR